MHGCLGCLFINSIVRHNRPEEVHADPARAFSPDRYGFAKEGGEEEPAAAAAATPSGAKLEDLKERYLGSTKSPSKVTHPGTEAEHAQP